MHHLAVLARQNASTQAITVTRTAPIRLSEETSEECSCTGRVILWTLAGVALGFGGAWFLNDAKKTELKERARARAKAAGARAKAAGANAMDRAAARLRA